MKKTFEHRERTSYNISRHTDHDPVGVLDTEMPITPQSRRRFKLMEEDSITLVFSLKKPMDFKIGDFINDELFGTFTIRERQLPSFNKYTGGWDYQLRFDNEYWLWENHLLMLAAPLSSSVVDVSENNDVVTLTPQVGASYKRIEPVWCLTAPLVTHVEQVLCNLIATGLTHYGIAYRARILPTATKAKEIRFLQYSATPICTALKNLAQEYECEWWVTYEAETTAGQTDIVGYINFGKCVYNEVPLVFRPGRNMENVTASRDTTSRANRIYVFGGTKNVPESYHRKLLLHVDSYMGTDGSQVFADTTRPIDPYTMLADPGTPKPQENRMLTFAQVADSDIVITTGANNTTKFSLETLAEDTNHTKGFSFDRTTRVPFSRIRSRIQVQFDSSAQATATYRCTLSLAEVVYGETQGETVLSSGTVTQKWRANSIMNDFSCDVYANGGVATLEGKKTYAFIFRLTLEVSTVEQGVAVTLHHLPDSPTYSSDVEGSVEMPEGKSFSASVKWNDGEGDRQDIITFNHGFKEEDETLSRYFKFDDQEAQSTFMDMLMNDETPVLELVGYIATAIPLSYYTEDTDSPSSLIGLGERRLRMPSEDYVETDGLQEVERVEEVVLADHIYPKCYLRVTSVTEEERRDRMELSDGSTYEWPWKAYTVEAEQINGDPFSFRRGFVKDGEKLQAVFLSDYDEQRAYGDLQRNDHDGYLLAGMTFDVAFEEMGTRRYYTLIRNEDYGAKLPNDVLKPMVGDVFVLTGWDVKAMDELGLVESAETELEAFADDYLNALQEDGWTFRCEMMSDWPWLLHGGDGIGTAALRDSGGKHLTVPISDNERARLTVRLGRKGWGLDNATPQYYDLPVEGTRVTVENAALAGGSKTSRVIGYELKLDIPYDSPVYEVGETEAYSRLKQLERKIQKLR